MPAFPGELAALLTSICWSVNSVFFTLAGRRTGSAVVNHIRLWIALFSLLLIHWLMYGTPVPADAAASKWLWFGLSGLFGFVLGDAFWLESLVLIGPRLAQLLMTLAPIFSALMGWLIFRETLSAIEICAVLLTVGGIAWVVTARAPAGENARPKSYLWGVVCGVIGALGQAAGYLFSKIGLDGSFSPVSGNLMRLSAATAAIVIIALFQGKFIGHFRRLRDGRAFAHIFGGAMLGPVIGVLLSLVALARARLGIASTLMSLSPVLLIPISHFLFKEKITWRAVAGTVIALSGAALLFLY